MAPAHYHTQPVRLQRLCQPTFSEPPPMLQIPPPMLQISPPMLQMQNKNIHMFESIVHFEKSLVFRPKLQLDQLLSIASTLGSINDYFVNGFLRTKLRIYFP